MNKSQAGRLGGLATLGKYGKEHMSAIGKAGARSFYERYQWTPYRQSGWAIIRKSDRSLVRICGEMRP